MKILGIETSCDDTSVAIVENGRKIIVNLIASQEKLHKKYGGVVPEVASRKHTEVINVLIEEAFTKSALKYTDVDAVAVTYGPGLIGSLLIGLSAAKAFAFTLDVPLIAVNHLEGHIYANFIGKNNPKLPLICLIVSGGHSEIVYMKDHGDYEILGRTRDDAAGEAFDKVARYLGIGYPGGPIIDKISKGADSTIIKFPKPLLKDGYDFSFSGLKTALINWYSGFKVISVHPSKITEELKNNIPNIVASFQEAVVEVLTEKTLKAALYKKVETIALAGGVSANSRLREVMKEKAERLNKKVYMPDISLCTDNAAMIACRGYFKYKREKKSYMDIEASSCLALV